MKHTFLALMFVLSGMKFAFSAPVLITSAEYSSLSGSGVETIEDFESFTPFNPFTLDSSQLQLSNGMFNGSDPNFSGGASIRVEASGNQYLADNGLDEQQTFNMLPANTTLWAVDIRWLSSPDPGGKFRVDVTSNSGSSTFFLGEGGCTYYVDGCPSTSTAPWFVGLYDPAGITSVSWLQYPGSFAGNNNWVGYAYDNVRTVSAVPLPAAYLLFGSGLVGLIAVAKRKALDQTC